MKCPNCLGKSKVYDSRPYNNTIRRHRKCFYCDHKYTTIEALEIKSTIAVPAAPKTTPGRKPRKPKRKPRFTDLDFDSMTDEELEAAIYEGRL